MLVQKHHSTNFYLSSRMVKYIKFVFSLKNCFTLAILFFFWALQSHLHSKLTINNIRRHESSHKLSKETFPSINQLEPACVLPRLEVWHPELVQHFQKPAPLRCNLEEENWVYVVNGRLF